MDEQTKRGTIAGAIWSFIGGIIFSFGVVGEILGPIHRFVLKNNIIFIIQN